MTDTTTAAEIARHPLHISVQENFADLKSSPNDDQASFTATIARILSDAFIESDEACDMPAFLTDDDVHILRADIASPDTCLIPGADGPVSDMLTAWHDARALCPGIRPVIEHGNVALCAPFPRLAHLIDQEVIRSGGILAFFDPIYEDSLILVRISAAALKKWEARTLSAAQAVA